MGFKLGNLIFTVEILSHVQNYLLFHQALHSHGLRVEWRGDTKDSDVSIGSRPCNNAFVTAGTSGDIRKNASVLWWVI